MRADGILRGTAVLAPLLWTAACHTGGKGNPTPDAQVTPDAWVAVVHDVTVNADGSFDPQEVHIREGDSVRWTLNNRADAIIPATWPGSYPEVCSTPKPWDPDDFTGPIVQAPGGVYTISPWDAGQVVTDTCAACLGPTDAQGFCPCDGGEVEASMDWTWQNPDIAGVFIRLRWSDVQIAPGTDDASFTWLVLDREIQKAVDNGKLYSLGFKAGSDGTPAWIFTNGVTPLAFHDGGTGAVGCGWDMTLGDPTTAVYQGHYFDLLSKVAEHIKQRADWYRALAYIKPSGANLESAENRLPRNCDAGCPICNSQVWAEAGYRPSLLYDYYNLQFDLLAGEYPGKQMAYALISLGFPLVGESGSWEGQVPTPVDLPGGVEQTHMVIDNGHTYHDPFFTIQHNALAAEPSTPNDLVINDGAAGYVTGFQTSNYDRVATAADVDSSLANAYDNTAAVFVELYEGQLWLAWNEAAPLSGNTVGDWNRMFQDRRQTDHPDLADPYPYHSHTFTGTTAGESLYYMHGSKCGEANDTYGVIVIDP